MRNGEGEDRPAYLGRQRPCRRTMTGSIPSTSKGSISSRSGAVKLRKVPLDGDYAYYYAEIDNTLSLALRHLKAQSSG